MPKWDYLVEGDAQVAQSIRAFQTATTERNLIKMLRVLKTHGMALHATGAWKPASSSLVFVDTKDTMRIQFSFYPRFPKAGATPRSPERVIEHLFHRPTTNGVHSKLNWTEINAIIAKNRKEMPYKELVPIRMPEFLAHYYV